MTLDFSSVIAQHDAQIAEWRTAVADRDHRISDLLAEIELLKNPPVARFPGDLGPGRVRLGVATANSNVARVIEHETAAKRPLARRTYYQPSDGVAPILPNGAARLRIQEDHKAGRIPVISIRPGSFAEIAAGKFDLELTAFRAWCEAQPLPVHLLVWHEPENKGMSPVDFCAAQTRVRRAIGTGLKRLSFGGSLMTYTWNPVSNRKPDEWFPGPGVWDWTGGDHYAQKAGTTIFSPNWYAFLASCKKWQTIPAVTELGIRSSDPDAAKRLRDFYEAAVVDGVAFILYYDSDVNSTQDGWILTGPQHDEWHALMADPRST